MELITHPLATLAVAWVVLVGLDFTLGGWDASRRGWSRRLVSIACWGVLGTFAAIVIWYATQVTYMDPAEPTITAVASIFGAGKPLYPALDAPERYAHVYGPDAFIVHAAAMAMFGPSIVVSKGVGAAAVLASLWLAYRTFARRVGSFAAGLASAVCALLFLDFGNASFWSRPDPLLIFSVVLGLVASYASRASTALVLLGVAIGLSANLKASGPVYLIPACILVGSTHGFRVAAGAAGAAVLLAAAPFVSENVSFAHYIDYLQLSAGNGLLALRLRQNIEWAGFLLSPLVVATYSTRGLSIRGWKSEASLIGIVCSVMVIAVVAAKPGAGPYHFLPLVPVVADAVLCSPAHLWTRRSVRVFMSAVALTALAVAVPRQITFVRTVRGREMAAVVQDLRRFTDAHPSSRVAVGYAGTSYVSYARPLVVFRTHDYLLDAPAIQEHRLSGLDVPASTLEAIADCRAEYWLIPKGPEPFAVPSAYAPRGPHEVFSDRFRRTFLAHHEQIGRTEYFTIWKCHRGT